MTLDNSWSFEELTPSQTSYITYSYHRYPAKFIPLLAARVILENSLTGDLVCDPFMGSATTLVEAIVHDREAFQDKNTGSPTYRLLVSRETKTPPSDHIFKD